MAQAQLPQWSVGSMTYRELSLALSDGEAAVYWCQRHKLLSDSKSCPKCGTDMMLERFIPCACVHYALINTR